MHQIIPFLPWIIGLLGFIVGSFLNVVILRKGLQTVGGRSMCPDCKVQLKWYDLVPVFSYIALRGKCRSCHAKISWQYPLVEFTTALLFFLSTKYVIFENIRWGGLPLLLVMVSFAIIIAVYDLRTKLVPLDWFIGLVISTLGYLIVTSVGPFWSVVAFHAAGLLVAVPFLALWIISEGRWMGFADIEIIAWIGMFFGIGLGISAVCSAFYLGALFAVGYIGVQIARGKSYTSIRKVQIPFAPFLIIAWIGTLFFQWNVFSLFAGIGV